MKHCTYCGSPYPDELDVCPADHTPLKRVGEDQAAPTVSNGVQSAETISPEEQRFWERMTFRQFAILIVRLQAVWLLFYAVVDVTYLPRYLNLSSSVSSYAALSRAGRLDLLLLILRFLLHVAVAVALIQHAEKVLSWLVKDDIPKQPPGK